MSIKCGMQVLGGVVAMTIAGAAFSNTSIDATTTGNVFLNIVDETNSTSFLYDTGLSQAAFNGSSSYSFNLSVDPNLKGFLNGTDTFDYSVISATRTGGGPAAVSTLDFTGGANATAPTPLPPTSFNLSQARSAINQFLIFANTVTSTTTNSAVIPTGAQNNGYWGQGLNEGVVSAQLFNVTLTPYAENAPLGTALSFFQAVGTTLTTFAGSWNFSAASEVLSYGQAGGGNPPPPVPLPTPLLLLVSGLGLIGMTRVRRRISGTV